MVTVPAPAPATTPEVPTVATAGLLLLHTPPPVASARAVVEPTQTTRVPVMGAGLGMGSTVTSTVVAALPQLLVTVYEITEVPTETPLTTPAVPTAATEGVALLHV